MKFELKQEVVIKVSGERGVIIGHAKYISRDPVYKVRYVSADERAVEAWWDEDALEAV